MYRLNWLNATLAPVTVPISHLIEDFMESEGST
jgi:hypothetical protein